MIDRETIEELEEIFIPRRECDKNVADMQSVISNLRVGFAELNTKMTILIAILGVVGTAIISACVKIFFA